MNFICIPSGIATHPNTTKLPTTYNPQWLPHPIEYPRPFARRASKNVVSATSTAISTVNTYASRPPGYGHIQCVGPNLTNTHTPATVTKSCQLPAAAPPDEAASPSGTNTNAAIAVARSIANVPVPTRYITNVTNTNAPSKSPPAAPNLPASPSATPFAAKLS